MEVIGLPDRFFAIVAHPEDGMPRALGPFVSPEHARFWCRTYGVEIQSVVESMTRLAWNLQAEERQWKQKKEGNL